MRDDALPALAAYRAGRPETHAVGERSSRYVEMRDGTRIAIDVVLPAGLAGERVPAIVRQTRYFRSTELAPWLVRLVGEERIDPVNTRLRRAFVARGYAWIDVDVRGSGASSGVWHSPWSPLEVADGAEIVDWIVRQPWSSGVVGATGNSYDGTAAEMLATTGHPALRAIAPRCSLYDVYTDIAYPGGLHQAWFTEAWTRTNMALDANHPARMVAEAIAQAHPGLATGFRRRVLERALAGVFRRVRAVDGDVAAITRAIEERAANVDLHALARDVEFRDDPHPSVLGPRTVDAFSPSAYLDRMRAARVAVLSLSGWFDAGYPASAIKRHAALADPDADPGARNRLVLGPWNHGAGLNMSPHARDRRAGFDLVAELLRFFDHHLLGRPTGIETEARVRYYVMGAETWRDAASWPPPDVAPRRLYLDADRLLADARSVRATTDRLAVVPTTGSGVRSRWRTLVSPFVHPDYPDREARGRGLVVYRTLALVDAVEIAGAPVVDLRLAADGVDGAVFAYLEDERADGRIVYITEGQLRLIHGEVAAPPSQVATEGSAPHRSYRRADARALVPGAVVRVAFAMLPTAYAFAPGSRIRLVLAGADVDHFAPVPGPRVASHFAISRGGDHASALELPVRG
jgi:putative CocE/NonD family hydrolase